MGMPGTLWSMGKRRTLSAATWVLVAGCTPAARLGQVAMGSSAAEGRVWADSVMATMSLRDRAAQLVWPWILGDFVPEGSAEWGRITRLVTEEHVGGFIVSVGGPMDIAAKVNALQRLSRVPLLMSADMETGAGFRARGGFFLPNGIDLGGATTFPLQMALGASGDTALAYQMARATAREGRALGLHVAFGPVLDVNNNPANPVIGARSFSEVPALTGRLGAAFVRGLQDHGMLATGKHFPGHGDTETNSHLALSVVTASRARLDSVELSPFRVAIGAGVGAIMTFHGFLPALDSSGVPATLSPAVMTDLLRRDLGFRGLLVTDAMDMAGVVDKFGADEAVKRAIAAGNDILLMPSDTRGAVDAVVAAVREGRITEARINESVRRVLELKVRFGLHRRRMVSLDSVRAIVGDPAHVALAQEIADRGVVLAADSAHLLPLGGTERPHRILSVTYARRADLSAGTNFNTELRRGGLSVASVYVNADENAPNLSHILAVADSSDVILLGSYVNISSTTATATAPPALADLVAGLRARSRSLVFLAFGSPYAIAQAPGLSTYLVAWGGSPASQRAAARALLGEIPISGRLPVSIPPVLPIGAGEVRAARPPRD